MLCVASQCSRVLLQDVLSCANFKSWYLSNYFTSTAIDINHTSLSSEQVCYVFICGNLVYDRPSSSACPVHQNSSPHILWSQDCETIFTTHAFTQFYSKLKNYLLLKKFLFFGYILNKPYNWTFKQFYATTMTGVMHEHFFLSKVHAEDLGQSGVRNRKPSWSGLSSHMEKLEDIGSSTHPQRC